MNPRESAGPSGGRGTVFPSGFPFGTGMGLK